MPNIIGSDTVPGEEHDQELVEDEDRLVADVEDISTNVQIGLDRDTSDSTAASPILDHVRPPRSGKLWFVYSQFRALFLKNFAKQKRQYMTNFFQLIFPLIVLLLPLIAYWTDLRIPKINIGKIIPFTDTHSQTYSYTTLQQDEFIDTRPEMITDYYFIRVNSHCCGIPISYNRTKPRPPTSYFICAVRSQKFGVVDLSSNAEATSQVVSNIDRFETMYYSNRQQCITSPTEEYYTNTNLFDEHLIERADYYSKCIERRSPYQCTLDVSGRFPVAGLIMHDISLGTNHDKLKVDIQYEPIPVYMGHPDRYYLRFLNMLSRAYFKLHAEYVEEVPATTLFVKEYPVKRETDEQASNGMDDSLAVSVTIFLFLPLSVQFLLPLYMFDRIKERSNTLRDYIKMFGVSLFLYDVVQYLFDYMLYLFVAIFTLIVGFSSNYTFFRLGNPIHYTVLLLLWGHLQIAVAYFMTCFIRQPRNAALFGYVFVLIMMVLAGAFNIFIFDMSLPPAWYLVVPHFVLYRCFAVIMFRYNSNEDFLGGKQSLDVQLVQLYSIMVLQTIVLQLIAATIEWCITYYKKNQHDKTIARIYSRVVSFIKSKIRRQAQVVEDDDDNMAFQMEEMDTDCMAERKMIEMNDFGTRDVCLSVNGLQKSYGAGSATNKTRKTIDNMYIALDRSECFGLLGKNGAGKTSFINTLTGFTPMDAGSVTINGISLAEAQKQKMLTLCPQHDTLFDQLSVEDHLLFLTRLKGLYSGFREEYQHVKEIIEEVGLEEARRRMAKDLSGGMKRRLSIAMALTGSPQLVLLDEPTTGLDPASRRDIWKIVSSAVKRKNRCVLLTTHDLEEAEALCNRIGIMHQGNLKCLGSLLHLKKKFGTGYKVSISVQEQKYITDIDARPKRSALTLEERVTGFVQNLLPKAVLDYSSEPYFVFRVQQIDIKLSQLFLAMDNQSERKKFSLSREDGFVCNWSVNHASLEDLFLTVVKPKLLERSRNV